MTSKLTRERLQEIAEDGFLKHGESRVLARMALAVMDSEPLAWTDEEELRDVERSGCGYLFTVKPVTPHADERRIILLYRHAQQPVVPDFETVLESLDYDVRCNIRESEHVYQASKATYDACRAAMLNHPSSIQPNTGAAPGAEIKHPSTNSPVIPEWIPVSERMPEERETVVLVADERGIVWCAEIQDGEIYPDEFPGTRGFGCAEATHWMPLPAAPQEVQDE